VRFETAAAIAIGLLLPVLETLRRGLIHWTIDSTTMLEDYLAGLLLLTAAVATLHKRPIAAVLMLMVWSGVTFMMTLSLISQIEDTLRATDLERDNSLVLTVKLLLWGTCALALKGSFQQLRRS
jgi:putative cell wall-binding protein